MASIVAVHQIGERIALQLDASMPIHLRNAQFTASLQATPSAVTARDYFALRKIWRAQTVPGVTSLVPVVHGVLALDVTGAADRLQPEATPVGSAQIVGLDWLQMLDAGGQTLPLNNAVGADEQAAPPTLLLPGATALDGVHPALVDAALGWVQGQQFTAGGLTFEVAGVIEGSSAPEALASVYVDIGLAQEALSLEPNQLSLIAISQNDPQAPLRNLLEKVMPGISSGLPVTQAPSLPAGWVAQGVADQMPQISFGRSVLFNLGALGSLSLVVAWFLIYQTAVLWLRRQALVYQRLLHQGVTLGQLRLVFCCALLLVGLVAGGLGLGLGLWFAQWLLAQLATAVATDNAQSVGGALALWNSFGAPVVIKALASAGLVSLLAALIAFERLWQPPGRATWKLWAGIVSLGLLLIFGLWNGSGLLGAFVAIAVSCVLVLLLLRPLLEALRRRAAILPGPLVWRMGVRELAWYPMDVAIALGAMVLAIATSVGVGTMVDSFRTDFDRMLSQRLAGDVQVRGQRAQVLPIVAALAQEPGITELRQLRSGLVNIAGQPVQLGLTRLDMAGAARYGLSDAVDQNAVLVNERLARKLSLEVGMSLRVQNRQLRIASIYPGYGDTQGQLVANEDLSWQLAVSGYQLQISAVEPQALVNRLQQEYPSVQIELRSSVRALALRVFDETFAITRALTYTALAVAAVGLYNALVGLSLLQQRSWRLLSVMGLALHERLGFALSRSALIFVVTSLLALPLGIVMGWMLCHLVNPRAFGWTVPLSWSGSALWLPLGVGAAVAVVAGLLSVPMQNAGAASASDD